MGAAHYYCAWYMSQYPRMASTQEYLRGYWGLMRFVNGWGDSLL